MRALIVTNMYPSPANSVLGSFVRDQVEALERIPELDVELYAFHPGTAAAYGRAASALRRRYRGERFDVVHAHFGLTAWPALVVRAHAHAVTLHGTDLSHPRSRALTTAALPLLDLVAAVSEPLLAQAPRWALRSRTAVLPAGVDTGRFKRIPRSEARAQLGLRPEGPYLLFAADPRRPEKRYDRARRVAAGVELLTLGSVDPAEVPLWVNAANAVLVAVRARGVRARGARGARVRRACPVHPGRGRARRALRHPRHLLRPVRRRRPGGRHSRRT